MPTITFSPAPRETRIISPSRMAPERRPSPPSLAGPLRHFGDHPLACPDYHVIAGASHGDVDQRSPCRLRPDRRTGCAAALKTGTASRRAKACNV